MDTLLFINIMLCVQKVGRRRRRRRNHHYRRWWEDEKKATTKTHVLFPRHRAISNSNSSNNYSGKED
jgi:hypothetical protein